MTLLDHVDDTLLDLGLLAESRLAAAAAFEAADRDGDAHARACAALELGGIWVHEQRGAVERGRMLAWQRKALNDLDPDDPLAVRLRVRLTCEAAFATGDVARPLAVLDEARSCGDPIALAEALSLVHHCIHGPDHSAQRLALADELIVTAALTGRARDRLLGLMWRTVDLILAGDGRADRSLRDLRDHLAVDHNAAIGFIVDAIDVMRSIRVGNFDVAERAALACFELGSQVGDADARGFLGAQLICLRWFQRRSAEVLDFVVDLASCPSMVESNDAILGALATLAADCGREDLARSTLAEIRRRPLDTTRSSSTWLALLVGVIEAAALLGDQDAARDAYDHLLPFADRPIVVSLGVACFGSAERSLAVAAFTFGDTGLAIEHAQRAVRENDRLGHRPAAQRSRELLADLERSALSGTATTPDGGCRFVRAGEVWNVTFGDTSCTLSHSIGVQYLAALTDCPDRWVRAATLAGRNDADRCAQPVIDRHAAAEYRRRVEELKTELAVAERSGSRMKADRCRGELDALLAELRRAAGLGTRTRSFTDDGERARIAVQKAIRRAIARIATVAPQIGFHLDASVETGAQCRYSTARRM